jgi:succinate dehydrogenase / fumarate reductase iron-sulfur subunit
MEPFFEKYRAVRPYLINDQVPPPTEWIQSIEERAAFDDTTKCILCAACTTSCGAYWANNDYIGPASLVQAHRFIFDSRDRGAAERLEVINAREGVWRCRTMFNCVEACPRDINITKAIGQIKKALLYNRL